MTQPAHNNLEQSLAAMTQWQGGTTALWRQALKGSKPTKPSKQQDDSVWQRVLTLKISTAAMLTIVFGTLFVVAIALNLPHLGRERRVPLAISSDNDLRGAGQAIYINAQDDPGQFSKTATLNTSAERLLDTMVGRDYLAYDASVRSDTWSSDFAYSHQLQNTTERVGTPSPASSAPWSVVRSTGTTPAQLITPSTVDDETEPAVTSAEASQRFVVQNATMELKTRDVRAAFLKVQHLVRPALGEFAQNSALTGSGKDAQANLTLRVASHRLSDVLNEIRELGEVTSERQGGHDVTGQVVDTEARLRNEKRVETEILELLQTREDAPLKDILDMREKLGTIRNEIERLTGLRNQLGKLVSLSTVLVLIRADDAPEPEPIESTLGQYFGGSIKHSWNAGLRFLADTLATMLAILIGGLVWWVLLIAAWFGIRSYRRRRVTAEQA